MTHKLCNNYLKAIYEHQKAVQTRRDFIDSIIEVSIDFSGF
jgi:hypothetical protein